MFTIIKCFLSSLLFITIYIGVVSVLSAPQKQYTIASQGIGQEKAIQIATSEVEKMHSLSAKSKIFTCERPHFWNVIFELEQSEHNIVECVLSKRTGGLIRINTFSLNLPQNPSVSQPLTKAEILEHVAKDASTRYKQSEYDVIACELSHSWRVLYDFRADGPVLSGGPQYLVNKYDGSFLSKVYFH